MKTEQLICIGCPMGCRMEVRQDNGSIEVSGNTCKRGEAYAKKEVTNPTRIVTSTVLVNGGDLPVVSVKTLEDIPKGKILQCIKELSSVTVYAPVSIGDVILENVAGTGVKIVATKNVYAADDRRKTA